MTASHAQDSLGSISLGQETPKEGKTARNGKCATIKEEGTSSLRSRGMSEKSESEKLAAAGIAGAAGITRVQPDPRLRV